MEQEFEIRPERPRRRALLGCLLGALFLLCAGAIAFAGWTLVGPRPTPVARAAPSGTPTPTPAASTATPAATLAPAAALPGRIAFVTGRGQIGTVAAGGQDSRTLTNAENFYLFPAWAPAGNRLAAIGSNRAGSGVYLLADDEDPALTTLYDGAANAPIYLSWSPGGDRVGFIARRGDSLGLYLAPADGSQDGELLATGQPFYWDWGAEGKRLLIHSGGETEDARLTFVDLAAGEAGENLAAPGFFQVPGISRDGAYVAFASVDEQDDRWLVVAEQAGATVQRVPHRGAVALGWSPTASQLAFISPEFAERRLLLDYYGPLRLLDAPSGETTLLVEQPVLAFFWAPDGEQIATLTISGADNRREAAWEQGRLARRLPALTPISYPFSTPVQHDGLRLDLGLVDVATGVRRHLFTFTPTDLFVRQFLPFFDQYARSHRLWAPDSSALVLPVREEPEASVYVVPVSGGEPRPVAAGEIGFWSTE